MNIVVIGTGYVGLVTGTCFAESGNDVTCVDINTSKVEGLNAGIIPIYEPGLEDMVKRNVAARRLHFTTNAVDAVPKADCIFIAVGTPEGEDGSADLKYVFGAAESIANSLKETAIVLIKSTVPVGTNRSIKKRLDAITGRDVHVASNPEFLKEGCAIDDFMKPDRVVVGVTNQEVAEVLKELYSPFLRTENPFLIMGLESAEMTKYVANCMLATKISFINEMANLCELVDADINDVRRGIGHDQRIGFQFLFPGAGYGGSCFPKDVKALTATASRHGFTASVLEAVDRVNDRQKHILYDKIYKYFAGHLRGKKIAVWGLSFKPRTDDIREAPSLKLIDALLKSDCKIHVHDPVAMENVKRQYGDKLHYHDHQYGTLNHADALAIVTEWNQYRNPDFDYIRHEMVAPVIFDGRNLFNPNRMTQLGIYYSGIGIHSDVQIVRK
ncbi:UDP-glucose dehydrogenase family protein [Planctomicrobium sp. SH668]|uniref:UDP-glucose dehydrogenase family protein n=1 Tax=Planctomicrobium sp. SH668 TaxID=3448126 RepID=UPI003F5B93C3